MYCEIAPFSLVIIWIIPNTMWAPNYLLYLFPCRVSGRACVDYYSAKNLRIPIYIFLMLSLCNYPLSTVLSCKFKLPQPPWAPVSHSSSQRECVHGLDFPSLLCGLETASRQWSGTIIGFTPFVSLFSRITAPCCLLSNVWKP